MSKVPTMSARLCIIEDDDRLRRIYANTVRRCPELKLVGDYPDAESATESLPAVAPDVVMMDINLPGMDGIECVRVLKEKLPTTQFLMVTVYEDSERIFSALKAGASGYLLKRNSEQELLAALLDISRGGSPMSSAIARKVVQSFQGGPAKGSYDEDVHLSPREKEILDHLARGYAYKQIAAQLDISILTVNHHIRNIYDKLHVHSRGEAVAKYLGA